MTDDTTRKGFDQSRTADGSTETTDQSASNSEDIYRASSPDTSVENVLSPDGGQVRSPFQITSEMTETRRDRYAKLYDLYIRAPVSIMRQDWRAIVGLAIFTLYVLVGTVLGRFIEPTRTGDGEGFIAPFETLEHPLGTDQLGRDLFAQTVHSTEPILIMMSAGALFTVAMGMLFGMLAGYKGGTVDTVLSTITDVFINIPGLPLVIVLSVLFEPRNPALVGILLSVAAWAGLARAIRSQILTLRNESFTEAARAMDIPTATILRKEILPHLAPYIVINLTNAARYVIFAAVALYYLGVLPFSDSNWGIMLNQAYDSGAMYRSEAIHWLLIPIVAIAGISISTVLLAQSLDRVFNPRARARHAKTVAETENDEEVDAESTDIMSQQV